MNSTTKSLSEASIGDVIPWLKGGINLYISQIGLLLVSSIAIAVLSAFSATILLGPLYAGFLLMNLRLLRGDSTVTFGDIFAKLDRFVDTFLLTLLTGVVFLITSLILGVIPVLGDVLQFLLSAAVGPFWALSLLVMVDKGLGVQASASEGFALLQQNPLVLIALGICCSLLFMVGVLVFIVGAILVMPIIPATMAYLYATVIAPTTEEDVSSSSLNRRAVVGE